MSQFQRPDYSTGNHIPDWIQQMESKLVNFSVPALKYSLSDPDMTADTYDITDGNNTQRLINNVTYDLCS